MKIYVWILTSGLANLSLSSNIADFVESERQLLGLLIEGRVIAVDDTAMYI